MRFNDVEVVRNTGLLLQCRVGEQVVAVPLARLLSGTSVSSTGDRGVLVLPRELAFNVGLAPSARAELVRIACRRRAGR